jgi:sugar/nucleoside kinase (ribokinase family)
VTEPQLDIVAIGNAIVDVISREEDDFIVRHDLSKGGMQLVDTPTAEKLYAAMGAGMEISGGSAANTLAGMAALGCTCGFIGQVFDDQLGKVFAHDIRALGIRFDTPMATDGPPTARCLIMVTPDAQRTMNTFLGASQYLAPEAIDGALIAQARILYLEGYLWDPEQPRAAMRDAIATARGAGRKIAFTLSDAFVIERHRADFLALIEEGMIDILFANEVEICSLTMKNEFEEAVAAVAGKLEVLVVTRSEQGAICLTGGMRYEVAAAPIDELVDTTGAGDLFAAGFLAGHVRGKDPGHCLKMGAIAAAEVISHYGARPESDLKALMGPLLDA